MKYLLSLALLLCVASHSSSAQFSKGVEVSGAIYLKNGSVIVSPFVYHEKEQVLFVEDRLNFKIYTTFHVDSFFYYDPELMLQRRFKKLEYQQRAHFFELVAQGHLEILRLRLLIDAPKRVVKSNLDNHRLNYDYFVLHNGELSLLRAYKPKRLKDEYPQLWKEIDLYMRDQNFIFYKPHHKIQILLKVNDLLSNHHDSSLNN